MADSKKTFLQNEYTVKELSELPEFPYRERMIREFIKKGVLKAKFYGYEKVTIPKKSVEEFLNKYKKTKKSNNKKKKLK